MIKKYTRKHCEKNQFPDRTINQWNKFPKVVVCAKSIHAFKENMIIWFIRIQLGKNTHKQAARLTHAHENVNAASSTVTVMDYIAIIPITSWISYMQFQSTWHEVTLHLPCPLGTPCIL